MLRCTQTSRALLLALVVAGLPLVAGCPRQPAAQPPTPAVQPRPKTPPTVQPSPRAPGSKLKFAIVPKMRDNPVFVLAKDGALAEAKALGDVEVLYEAPPEGDAVKQAEIVRSLIAKRVDGMAISCNNADVLKDPINEAMAAGIPTICFDSDSPGSQRILYYGVDSRKAGAKLGELLVKALGTDLEGDVGQVTGVAGAPNLEERMDGLREYLAQKAPKLKLLPAQPCDDSTTTGLQVVQDILRGHPDLKGLILVGGWPIFSEFPGPFAEYPEPTKAKVVSFDALETEWEYVRRGYVYALVAQRCFHWGKESVRILHEIVVDKRQYDTQFVDGGMDLVVRDKALADQIGGVTVDVYAERWRTKRF